MPPAHPTCVSAFVTQFAYTLSRCLRGAALARAAWRPAVGGGEVSLASAALFTFGRYALLPVYTCYSLHVCALLPVAIRLRALFATRLCVATRLYVGTRLYVASRLYVVCFPLIRCFSLMRCFPLCVFYVPRASAVSRCEFAACPSSHFAAVALVCCWALGSRLLAASSPPSVAFIRFVVVVASTVAFIRLAFVCVSSCSCARLPSLPPLVLVSFDFPSCSHPSARSVSVAPTACVCTAWPCALCACALAALRCFYSCLYAHSARLQLPRA